MDTEQVWETIGNIPVGTVIAWGLVIIGIITSAFKAVGKLYSLFKEYQRKAQEDDEIKQMVSEHDKAFGEFRLALGRIERSLEEQKDVNLKQIRHTIVHTCDDAIADGYITAGKLRSLEEMYDEYTTVFNGNGYVKILVEKTRQLPVRGKLDE